MTVRGLVAAFALAGALLAPVASAQERTPSPQELWEAYPANPGGEPTVPPDERAPGAAATPRGPAATPDGSSAGAAERSTPTADGSAADDGGLPLGPILLGVAVVLLALVGAGVHSRRRGTRSGTTRGLALRHADRPVLPVAAEPPPPAPPVEPAPPPRRIDWREYPKPARPAPPPPPAPQPRTRLEREPTP